jgi:iron complex transport system permease protein
MSKQKHIKLIPEALFFGSFALLLSDFIAKNALAFEMPVGVVTSIVGVPFLFIILKRSFNAES